MIMSTTQFLLKTQVSLMEEEGGKIIRARVIGSLLWDCLPEMSEKLHPWSLINMVAEQRPDQGHQRYADMEGLGSHGTLALDKDLQAIWELEK